MMSENQKSSLQEFEKYLNQREKHRHTVEKYVRDVRKFFLFAGMSSDGQLVGGEMTAFDQKEILQYKKYLIENYKPASVNSMLAALNSYLEFMGKKDWQVRLCRIQKRMFREEEKELSIKEYQRLVKQAEKEGNLRLGCILQTIGSTGIRIGELSYITVEAMKRKMVNIYFKGKSRCVLLPDSLVRLLKMYCKKMKIMEGCIFVTRNGRPVDRRNIWSEMKKLCKKAGVPEGKGFPHNLRHLFACLYYKREKDVIRLADYLGHSNVETTRRYIMVSDLESCRKQLEMGMMVSGIADWQWG